MPQIAVTAVAAVSGKWEIDAMLLAVSDPHLRVTASSACIVASPWSDSLRSGASALMVSLEAHLIVAFPVAP